ncbi:MAG TPA: DUF835 domain-containing protein [Candidatus Thalassarchaeaceae archaeon]|nr:DUF835 domain-containing protein [Candidatus Thalassarchaeaceae archaeon]DAC51235.1 MAG TPA: DUF835 domain-containing protein [Candidatus Poseidoniales archaeon]HIH82725.1 DUF835 domain-containing protein [Candidatus Thalassarchaeaceae archaeon]
MSAEWPPGSSRLYGMQLEDPREGYVWLQKMNTSNRKIVVLSRLSPAKLSRWINLEVVDFHWITSKIDSYAIDPALERLKHFVDSLVIEDEGIIWLDAVEYLVDTHGFDSSIQFIQSVGDSLMDTNWTMVMPYSPLAFKSTEVAKMRREAPNYTISTEPENQIIEVVDSESDVEDSALLDALEGEDEESLLGSDIPHIEVEPGLVVLSRIPEKSLSRAILQRRIEQWSVMGFDVSELEPLLLVDGRAERYARYFVFEEKIRRATECERRIRELEQLGFTKEVTKLHFRIMQLTGIEDVEKQLQLLLAEAR